MGHVSSVVLALISVSTLVFSGALLVPVRWPPSLQREQSQNKRQSLGRVVRFASVATELNAYAKALNDSCAPNTVEFLGVGRKYVSSRTKLDHTIRWLRTLDPDTLVVLLDSADVVCLPCGRDLRTEYIALGYDIVFGGSCRPYPDFSMRDWFPIPSEKPATTRRYLNAGTIMGRASAIQYYCTQYYLRTGGHHDAEGDDQRFWQDQFLAGYNRLSASDEPTMGIDYDGRLFQVLRGGGDQPECGKGCWGVNTTTGYVQVKRQCQEQLYSTPACILHAPGRDKATFKDMFDTLANTRKDTRPWVELY